MPQKKAPRGKIARQLGTNVFGNPKYDRILKKKPHGPGKNPKGPRPRKKTEYGKHLLEKQKVRSCYGLYEKQFRNTFMKAKQKDGVTGVNLIQMLESRLDNLVYRLGWAVSREQARQMVSHKHIKVNGVISNIPSMQLQPGDKISIRERKNVQTLIRSVITGSRTTAAPWLEVDNDSFVGIYKSKPSVDAAQPPGDLQAIIEFYSQ